MDSLTIEKLLKKEPLTGHSFHGVFSRDNLPTHRTEGLYIVNKEPLDRKGSHWIAIHITPKRREAYILTVTAENHR